MRIIVDMDELLADFVGGAAKLHGITLSQLHDKWPIGTWDMSKAVGLAKELPHAMSLDEFWHPINCNATFWERLKQHSWAYELMNLVYTYAKDSNDWLIVSSPARCESSHVGKIRWLRRFFNNPTFDRFCLTPHKEYFAMKDAVLIDDRESNCEEFRRHGGQAILFPAYNNGLYTERHSPLTHVKSNLKAMYESLRRINTLATEPGQTV